MMSAKNNYGELLRISNAKHKHHGKFSGEVARIKKEKNTHGFKKNSILIKSIKNVVTGEVVSERMWFEYTDEFQRAGKLKETNIITFESKPKAYTNRVLNSEGEVLRDNTDYTFCNPVNVQLI